MTTINLSRVRPSANVHMDPMSLSSRVSACKGVSRRMLCQQVRVQKGVRPAIRCMTSAEQPPLQLTASKASLRKCTKAQLVSHAQQMGMDESGTKNDLVERLLVTLSTEAVAQPFVPANDTQEEVHKLQAEVNELDCKLIAVTQALTEATTAREDERQQLASVIADMATMRESWQTDVHQVEELAVIAGHLEQSERDILNLRSQQGRFEERVAMMQGLLKEREQEILTLKAQLSEFQQPAVALAGGSTAGVTSWDSETAAAAEPVRSSAYSNASWANDWNTAMVQNRDSDMAGLQVATEAGSALQPVEASISREGADRQHATPGLAIVAAVGAAAHRGGAAWDSVRSLLPQDKRFYADAALAAGATALLYSVYS